MAIIIIATLLCLLNIILWIIFAAKFKRIFSTDDIIEKTRDEINHMIIDMNRNADRNITLIDEKIKELKAVTAEAERRLALEKSEDEKREKVKALSMATQQINEEPKRLIGKIETQKSQKQTHKTNSVAEIYMKEQSQGDLFSATDNKENQVEEEKESDQKIPVVVPKVYLSDKPITPKKDFNTLVKEKIEQGETIEDIAAELGRSTQEVKFALEFS